MARISGILRCVIVLLIADSTLVNFRVFTHRCVSSVVKSFEAFEIVPVVVPKAPNTLALVSYRSGVSAKKGNELTPTEVKDQPTVTWDADPGKFYIVACIDPDVPSRKEPSQREFQHWLVGNVPGNNVDAGEVLTAYIGSGPEKYTGLHRYTYLVYKQPYKIAFDEQRINNTTIENRPNFSIAKFAKKYNLGDPIAGNFYQAEYDDYVPVVHIQLNDPNYV